MDGATNGKDKNKMLSQQDVMSRYNIPTRSRRRDNKHVHYQADPHIQYHKGARGSPFYTYRRGEDKEIYLGTAETILRAVTFYREGKVNSGV